MSRTVPLPNEVTVKNYPTPSWASVIDEMVVERVEYNKPGYVKAIEGSAHPNIRDFPNHKLLKVENSDQYGIELRYYCNGYRNEDQYNYDINFSGESNSHPIFTRRYLVRRDLYARPSSQPLTKEAKFTGVYLIEVTNPGSGFTSQPTVVIEGNATAEAVLTNDGKIAWIYLTSEGSGYTETPTVNIGGGGGVGATALAKLQLDTGVVYQINVTAGGTGYTTVPGVVINSASGSGATAVAQIQDGAVVAILVTAYGSGYLTAPTVTITGGGGTGATATAVIETATCRLIKEDAEQFPEQDPRRSLYLLVTRTYETFPGPYLLEHKYEKYLDWYVSVLKRTVLASTVPPDMTYVTKVPGQITEYHPLSKHRAIQVISSINTGIAWENDGPDVTYKGTVNYSFPNWIEDDPVIDVVEAHETVNGSTTLVIDFGWKLNVKEGYSGPCEAIFTRRCTFDPDDPAFEAALPTLTYIQPEGDVINERFAYSGANLIARANQFVIPSTLHPELEVTVDTHGSTVVTALEPPVATVAATIPTKINPGDEIVASIKPTLYDFGLYIYQFVTVIHPTPPA